MKTCRICDKEITKGYISSTEGDETQYVHPECILGKQRIKTCIKMAAGSICMSGASDCWCRSKEINEKK